jgi:polygalacturonase
MIRINKIILLIISVVFLVSCAPRNIVGGIPNFKWIKEVGSKKMPPSSKIYNASEYGAKPDTSYLSTTAIQKAIDECSANGGGIVTLNPGKYCTGTIYIKSGVNFNLPEGVEIYGSRNLNDYPEIDTRVAGVEMKWPSALITAIDQDNVALTGKGKVWGQGKIFWDKYWAMRKDYDARGLRWIVDYDCSRPRLILFQNCTNVTMKGNDYLEAGFWTVHILYSSYVTIDGVKIENNNAGKGPSTDGIDIDSSNRILVENCDISCNDDNFCLKAGRDADGLRVNRPTEYVVIRNCISRQGGGLFTCGSETSGSIRNIVTYNMVGVGTSVGLRFKSALNRGGVIEDIYIANVNMTNVRDPFQITLNWNPSYSYSELPKPYVWDSIPNHWKVMLTPVSKEEGLPKVKNIHITNVKSVNGKTAMICEGVENSAIDSLYLKNVDIVASAPGRLYWAKDWKLENVRIGGKNGEKVDTKETKNVPLYD